MKKRGMKKRVLAALMTACMVVGSVPGVSLADVETSPSKALGINNPGPSKFMLDGNDYTTTTGIISILSTTTQEDACTPAGMRSTASGITSTQHPTREHLAQCLRTPQHRMDIR